MDFEQDILAVVDKHLEEDKVVADMDQGIDPEEDIVVEDIDNQIVGRSNFGIYYYGYYQGIEEDRQVVEVFVKDQIKTYDIRKI